MPKAAAAKPFWTLLSKTQRDVDARLGKLFGERRGSLAKKGPEVAAMVQAIAELCLRHGKRLRPALVVVGLEAARPGSDRRVAVAAGAALELLHTYLLIHDDWMDGDVVRRGGPTVHVALARKLGSERLGAASAILAGDYALGLATEALAKLEVPESRVRGLLACFSEMHEDAVLGQELDIAGASHDPEVAYALKTGSYTVRGPLRLGALLGNAKPATLRMLDAFAMPVGIAFQLRDDLLSAFGDPKATGKPLGNDLRAGKRTPLVLQALRRARKNDRSVLDSVFGKVGATDSAVRRALDVIEASGAREAVEARIAALLQEGLGALGPAVSREGRALLEGAALALTARTR